MKRIATDKAPEAIGPYSQAIVANGMIFCSGQIPLIASGGDKLDADAATQTELCLANLAEVLGAAGACLSDVVKTSIFVTDMNDFAAINAVYAEAFGDHRPARATVEVSRLPKDAKVEIECVALVPQD